MEKDAEEYLEAWLDQTTGNDAIFVMKIAETVVRAAVQGGSQIESKYFLSLSFSLEPSMFPSSKVQNKAKDPKWIDENVLFLKEHLAHGLNIWSPPFLPDTFFYFYGTAFVQKRNERWQADDKLLEKMASAIFKWLQISQNKFRIAFQDELGHPGVFTVKDGVEVILIDSKHKTDSYAVGAILAHEMAHLLLGRMNIRKDDTEENELLADLTTIYTGLGILVINGMTRLSNWILTLAALFGGIIYSSEHQSYFGYFSGKDYGRIFVAYLRENSVPLGSVRGFINPYARPFVPGLSLIMTKGRTDSMIRNFEKAKYKNILIQSGAAVILIFLYFSS